MSPGSIVVVWVAVVAVGGVSMKAQDSGGLPPASYSHRVVMDTRSGFTMLWTAGDDHIDIEVQVGTTGYVGLGFSPSGGMKGADIVLGWVDDATGQVFLQDRHATGNSAPIVDESQDVELLGGYQNDTHTVLRFSRRWATLDLNGDFMLSDDTARVIWAYSSQDPEDEAAVSYHEARGTKSLYLREPQFTLPLLTPDVKTLDIFAPNVSLPDDLTTLYWCKLYKIPPLSKKNHIIGYIPLIEEKNLEHVHHFVLNECIMPNSEQLLDRWTDWEGTQCDSPNMPVSWQYCFSTLVAWGVGGQGEMLPDHVGFPMGEEHGGATYLMMNIHYDNPNRRQGVVDNSGVRIFYTEKLREHDAGTMLYGQHIAPYQFIPPNQKWHSVGYCHSSCTSKALPTDGIKLFQGFLHTHLLGSSVVLRHERDGRELPTILKDMNYDFNYQHIRILKEEVTVLPGDTLITDCIYDSSGHTAPTFFGLGTDEEMCLAYLSYYPRINMYYCVSEPLLDNILDAMEIENVTNKSLVESYLHPEKTDLDEAAENRVMEWVKSGNVTKPKPMIIAHLLNIMNVTAPQKYFNRSFYNILKDEATWRDGEMTANLQDVVTTGSQYSFCKSRDNGRDFVPDGVINAPKLTVLPNTLPDMEFIHRIVLDWEGSYVLLWTPREKDIVFEVQVGTTGYVGLGFSPNGGMKGADIVLGWVDDATGQVFLQDRHATGNSLPIVDESQDVKLLGGYQNDTHTVLRFSRPWDTCDSAHDLRLSDDTVRMIWAYSSQDPEDEAAVSYHEARGTKSLYLQEPQFTLPPLTPDVRSWDFVVPNVSIPGDLATLYWCKVFKIPPLPNKNHIIGHVPLIEEKNSEVVHHIILFECHVPDTVEDFERWINWKGTQCYSANMPTSWKYCESVVAGWAVGGEGDMLPEHVGYPMGGEHEGTSTYYMIQLHYDNPNLRQGIVDASGIRLFFTEKLRQYDAGTLTFGHLVTPVHIIPPGQQHWVSRSFCDASCTKGLRSEGVKIFQGLLHSHLLGSSVSLRHVRDGQELPGILEDMNYDFNYQHTRILEKEVTILPGDTFITECGYDSSGSSTPIFGGLGTDEEMCLAYMSYYPRGNLTGCLSEPQMEDILHSLGVEDVWSPKEKRHKGRATTKNAVEKEEEDVEQKGKDYKPKSMQMSKFFEKIIITAPEKYVNRSLLNFLYDEATWQDSVTVVSMQEAVNTGVHTVHCEKDHKEQRKKQPYPTFTPLEPQLDQCSVKAGASSVTPPVNQEP